MCFICSWDLSLQVQGNSKCRRDPVHRNQLGSTRNLLVSHHLPHFLTPFFIGMDREIPPVMPGGVAGGAAHKNPCSASAGDSLCPALFQSMLFVEIPEYRNKHIRTAVKVNFYVINGKRKRSQPQHFTYHPGNSQGQSHSLPHFMSKIWFSALLFSCLSLRI